ncbi:hypothetical protein RFI_09475 [Reticulomyxa filosa]|uniref:Transmembrane protein n=1 Tax=Reticulomyxa filosa TaxID=46433 RepID=X6NNZ5_RETFI|nr:hypothetical protein RFI_09475 [Reticulomyxa filosa]|eukprot:ETO27658.1 hypothetical protein RFI_09475 [Reticulomyxa filosa]
MYIFPNILVFHFITNRDCTQLVCTTKNICALPSSIFRYYVMFSSFFKVFAEVHHGLKGRRHNFQRFLRNRNNELQTYSYPLLQARKSQNFRNTSFLTLLEGGYPYIKQNKVNENIDFCCNYFKKCSFIKLQKNYKNDPFCFQLYLFTIFDYFLLFFKIFQKCFQRDFF